MGRHAKPRKKAGAHALVFSSGLLLGALFGIAGEAIGEAPSDIVAQSPSTSELTAETADMEVAPVQPNFAACPPTARVCVDLNAKQSWTQKGGAIDYGPVPINHGQVGWETPTGTFHVMRKVKDEVSMEFDLEKMPWSTYFSPRGIAFHEGDLAEESHGCVHLSPEAAQHYYETLQISDLVVIF